MFKKLKEKLGNWTKKVSKHSETKEEKEVEIPQKFNVGAQKFEPDLEKIQEIIEKESKKEKIIEKKEDKIPKEEPKGKKESFFKKIKSSVSKVKISEKDFNVYAEELEMLLLENNVAFEVVEKIIKKIKEEMVDKNLLKKEVESEIKDVLKDAIREVLVEPFDLIEKIKEKNDSGEPYVILFCGINGTGKTTTIAKLGNYLKNKKLTSVIAAADTFRAASIEQLKKHGDKLDIKIISHDYGVDPASVGFDAIKYAKKNKINCVMIDTAGRMHTAKNLMKEIEKISKVCKPDLKIFIGESITGNDSIEQIKSFDWAVGIDGIILTKADIDEKGGTAISLSYSTKKPILFLGTGQEYGKIEKFDREKFIEKLGL